MHFREVFVHRNETAALSIRVGDWEVAVLEAKHPEGAITLGELVDKPGRAWPTDPRSEMQRLSRLYGMRGTGETAVSFAEFVFGSGRSGIDALAAAIEKARKAAPKSKQPSKAASDLVGAATA